MKFLVPNYSCLQNPWLRGYCPQIPILSVLNWICWTPLRKKFLSMPLVKWYTYLLVASKQWEEPKFVSHFSSFEAVWSLLKVLNMWDLHWQAKQVKVCIHLSLKTEESLPMTLITSWEFLLGESGTFWKWTWTCVRLLPNSWVLAEK